MARDDTQDTDTPTKAATDPLQSIAKRLLSTADALLEATSSSARSTEDTQAALDAIALTRNKLGLAEQALREARAAT